jgi:hypothetical protein
MLIRQLLTNVFTALFAAIGLTSCHSNSYILEPKLSYTPHSRTISLLETPFKPLKEEEKKTNWGTELYVGKKFAQELDFYRAITAFKRASYLIPQADLDRGQEIEFSLFFSYYLAQKMSDAVEVFEYSSLSSLEEDSPFFNTLIFLLQDAYYQAGLHGKSRALLPLVYEKNPEKAKKLEIYHALQEADLTTFQLHVNQEEKALDFMSVFQSKVKSVKQAQTLNALLPGAGYYYVGQKKSALTSLLLNVLTTAAAIHFYHENNYGASFLFASAELGWYVGGINGAGLAAKEYNEFIYNDLAKNYLLSTKGFPLLSISKGF